MTQKDMVIRYRSALSDDRDAQMVEEMLLQEGIDSIEVLCVQEVSEDDE